MGDENIFHVHGEREYLLATIERLLLRNKDDSSILELIVGTDYLSLSLARLANWP